MRTKAVVGLPLDVTITEAVEVVDSADLFGNRCFIGEAWLGEIFVASRSFEAATSDQAMEEMVEWLAASAAA